MLKSFRLIPVLVAFFFISAGLKSQTSYNTKFGIDSVVINYTIKEKKGTIKAKHNIPLNQWPIEESALLPSLKESDTIKSNTFNYHFLNKIIFKEANKYRQSLKLHPLMWSDSIFKAANHHSLYQAYFNVVGHGEDSLIPGKENEKKLYEKTWHKCFEICTLDYFLFEKCTYLSLANKIITNWKNSKKHNEILTDSKFKTAAFAALFTCDYAKFFTRTNLEKYNPALISEIEKKIPDYFEKKRSYNNIYVICTGMLCTSDSF